MKPKMIDRFDYLIGRILDNLKPFVPGSVEPKTISGKGLLPFYYLFMMILMAVLFLLFSPVFALLTYYEDRIRVDDRTLENQFVKEVIESSSNQTKV